MEERKANIYFKEQVVFKRISKSLWDEFLEKKPEIEKEIKRISQIPAHFFGPIPKAPIELELKIFDL